MRSYTVLLVFVVLANTAQSLANSCARFEKNAQNSLTKNSFGFVYTPSAETDRQSPLSDSSYEGLQVTQIANPVIAVATSEKISSLTWCEIKLKYDIAAEFAFSWSPRGAFNKSRVSWVKIEVPQTEVKARALVNTDGLPAEFVVESVALSHAQVVTTHEKDFASWIIRRISGPSHSSLLENIESSGLWTHAIRSLQDENARRITSLLNH